MTTSATADITDVPASIDVTDVTASNATTPPAAPIGLGDLVVDAAARQGATVVGILRRTDPQAWLFAERALYLRSGSCDPYAEQLLRRAGFLRD